jgi:D-sedoheptulose 7-phosphate isomerase
MKISTMRHLDDMIARSPERAVVREPMMATVELIGEAYRRGRKVLVCGNGGSAADSDHIVGELMKGFVLRRELPQPDVEKLRQCGCEELAGCLQQGIQAISLTGHPALSTAVLNDNDPYIGFAQQVYIYGRPGDILLGLSTSGNARNVLNAFKVARAFGVATVGFTGSTPGKIDEFGDVLIKVPETETFKVQEFHLPIYHTICLMVEEEVFGH